MDSNNSLPRVLTVEEAGKVLRISRGSAYEGIRAGEIPHVRIGRTIRVPRHALLALLGENRAGDAPAFEDARSQSLPSASAGDERGEGGRHGGDG